MHAAEAYETNSWTMRTIGPVQSDEFFRGSTRRGTSGDDVVSEDLRGASRTAWFRIASNEEEQRIVHSEREMHPDSHVRRKMLVLWLLHCKIPRVQAAEVAGVGRAAVQRYVAAYRDRGLERLRRRGVVGPVSELADYTEAIRQSLAAAPARTISEACDRIEKLTGLTRKHTQVRKFLVGLGFSWRRSRAVPVPPKKT